VQGDERNWLEEFKRINGLTVTGSNSTVAGGRLNRILGSRRALSNDVAQAAPRKGPHRLGRIIDGDQLAIRIDNLRSRKRKPARNSR
jgi:hypothetical protein